MKYIIKNIEIDKLRPHPYHQEVYESNSSNSLMESFKRTGNKPMYPIVVVPNIEFPDLYWVVSGMSRLETLIQMEQTEVEVIVYEITDDTEIKNLIVDLNKQRVKSGRELLREFRHFLEMYPEQRGIPGNRYSKIGKEIGRSTDRVKDYVILNKFFEGEGDVILENMFEGTSLSQVFQIKKVVEKYPEKFNSEKSFEKICDRRFDYSRLEYGIRFLSLEDDLDYELLKSYLQKDLSPQDFHKKLQQIGKVEKLINNHEKNKVSVPIVDEVYTTDNTHIIKGNNREVEFLHPFKKEINCLIGSPPYGNRRLNGDDKETDTGHNMSGREYGIYLSETYERYIPHMSKDGSIYVIIDDYRLNNGSFSCSLEHFVVEMERKGFFLVGRYPWIKNNPMPRSYKDKDMVNGFEMVYRFSLTPNGYYCNPDLFLELEKGGNGGFQEGCTNTTGDGKTSRGTSYYQSHLKKLRNTLDEKSCGDIIRGNVSNPEDFFRQVDEKRHTSTSPIYLTSTLILESTRPGDLVVDIWNGVGNTMVSTLLLQRKYVGVELENDYFQQTCRRVKMTEERLNNDTNEDLSQAA